MLSLALPCLIPFLSPYLLYLVSKVGLNRLTREREREREREEKIEKTNKHTHTHTFPYLQNNNYLDIKLSSDISNP